MGEPGAARLVCTAGPFVGRAFELVGEEVLIGRAEQSMIAIPDLAVSRSHLLLRRCPSGWTARDLGSGNGTILNRARILEETALGDGDILHLGNTRLSFRIADNTRVGLKSKRWVLFRRGAVLAVVVSAVALAWMKRPANAVSFRQGLEGRRARESLESAFQSGKKLVRQGDWDQALVTFERIRSEAPDFPGLQQYIDRGTQEVRNQAFLASARAALEKNELGAAAEALAKVGTDTQLHLQLQEVRDLLGRRVALRIAEAQGAFRDRDYPRALAVVEDALKAVPDDPEALSLADRAGRAAKARQKPAVRALSTAPADDAAARFRAGDLKGALAAAERCAARHLEPCRRLHRELEQFAELYRRMEQLELKDLERLLDLGVRAGGGRQSSLALAAMARAAALYYNEASDAKTAGQWARAVDLATKAQRLAPAHPGALAIVAELKARAKELFVFAYSLKDTAPDEAVVRFKEVIALTRPDDETHRKAVSWVGKLSR